MKERRLSIATFLGRGITVKDLLWASMLFALTTTAIIFLVVALVSQGDKELARRVDLNAQVSRLLVQQHNFQQTCTLEVFAGAFQGQRAELQKALQVCITQAEQEFGPNIDAVLKALEEVGDSIPIIGKFPSPLQPLDGR